MISLGMKFWGGIQANRNTKDMSFIDKSASLISKGKLVQIFPEGRNTDDGSIKRFYPSYLLIALKAGAPIIPIISDGSYSLTKRTHIMVGDPIYMQDLFESPTPDKEELSRANDAVRQIALDMHAELLKLKNKNKR
jgi:1-acyl-sn-glycerol-3-phosphate acyltransferase